MEKQRRGSSNAESKHNIRASSQAHKTIGHQTGTEPGSATTSTPVISAQVARPAKTPKTPTLKTPEHTQNFDKASSKPSSYSHDPAGDADLAPKPRLSLLEGLLIHSLQDYAACEKYCRNNPDIWEEDVSELRTTTCRYLDESKTGHARRCAERWLMVSTVQKAKLAPDAACAWLKRLTKGDSSFQSNLDKIITEWGQEAAVPVPIASTASSQSAQLTKNLPKHTAGPSVEATNNADLIRRMETASLTSTSGDPFKESSQHMERTSLAQSPPSPRPPRNKPRSGSFVRDHHRVPNAAVGNEEPEDIRLADVGTAYADTIPDTTLEEQGISNTTEGLGPELSLIKSYRQKNDLYASYKLRTGREAELFFIKGRVFAMVWHENAGSSMNPRSTEDSAQWDRPFHWHTRTKDGVDIFSHIRRFVIVKTKAKRRYCLAVPINSYGNQGLTKVGMRMEEKQAHTIIYAHGTEPTPLTGEVDLDKEPIEVEMAAGETLNAASRIHFGKMQTVEWNVRVKNVGLIKDEVYMRRLINYFNQEHFSPGDDTGTEKGKGKRMEKNLH